MNPIPTPTMVSIKLPGALAEARYASASDDGATLALALDVETGEVAVVRDGLLERMPGWLVPATTPLVATVGDTDG
jgi:hypothetical protein